MTIEVDRSDGIARNGSLTIAGRTIPIAQRRGPVVGDLAMRPSSGNLLLDGSVAGPASVTNITWTLTGATRYVGTASVSGGNWTIGPFHFERGRTAIAVSAVDAEGNTGRITFPIVAATFGDDPPITLPEIRAPQRFQEKSGCLTKSSASSGE